MTKILIHQPEYLPWIHLFEKISNAINVVSERENFTHVFSAGVPGVDVLLYAKPSDDISNLVLGELGIDPPSPSTN